MSSKNTFVILTKSTIICLGIRLFPFHIPNVEPLLAFSIPLHQRLGFMANFFFTTLSIISFDFLTGHVGSWTYITALTYSFACLFFPYCTSNNKFYTILKKTIIGTLFFDLITGLYAGPLFFNQPLTQAFLGQVSFTAIHLLNNIILGLSLSPLVDHWIKNQIKYQRKGVCFLLGKKVL